MLLPCPKWEDQSNLRCIFPVICEVPGIEMQYIYPLQQCAVRSIWLAVKDDKRIDAIVLFGSSVNLKCTKHSDIDLAVRLKEEYVNNTVKNEVSERIQEACDWHADILWRDRMKPTDRIYKNVLKGVRIL